ncbi:stress response translation initiation inhibitor YciH [Aestuariibacter salexigens]|uniref:stress response translation initiation inhibitor YciH n=1 Tax=Aestuariibacter salexigens TaxID=226010 RepID=UPI000427DC2D|nr:stress response translation initiation inhibitor YciH [Aestuariibacter salexigens]
MQDNKLVYSTDSGRIHTSSQAPQPPKGDGIVRIRRETKGRKGKGMSIIEGLGLDEKELKSLCKALKQLCGCGGAVKQFSIEIQGDNREKLKQYLEQKGYKVKLAGG